MQANKTVKINGRLYDAVTGLPVAGAAATKPAAPAAKPVATPKTSAGRSGSEATAVHSTTQRSKTLNRRATKKPGLPKRPQPGKHMDIARSHSVARFAPHPVTEPTQKPKQTTADAPAKTHPVAKRAVQKVAKRPASVAASAQQVKNAAITKALSTPTPVKKKEPFKKKVEKKVFKWTQRKTIVSALLVVLLGAGIVTYFNLPHLSVALASAQSGVSATYPKYVPDGFGLSQPVTFSEGQVSLRFTSNTGNGAYTITQENSSWDSSAVLDNVVRKEAGDNYVVNQERGLTLYSYDNNSQWAWVTGGILYLIDSEAPLSSDQIRRIATSL